MTVNSEPQRPLTERDIEDRLTEARAALIAARTALLQDDDIDRLAAERDRLEAARMEVLARRHDLRVRLEALGGHLGPLPGEAPVELVTAIRVCRIEYDQMTPLVADADADALRAVQRHNAAASARGDKRAYVRQLEALISSDERELLKIERAAPTPRRAWRDLIVSKH